MYMYIYISTQKTKATREMSIIIGKRKNATEDYVSSREYFSES